MATVPYKIDKRTEPEGSVNRPPRAAEWIGRLWKSPTPWKLPGAEDAELARAAPK
jgi:hypothetical protein